MTKHRGAAWLGASAMFVITVAPIVLFACARRRLSVQMGDNVSFEYGQSLAFAPAFLSTALLAPLAGMRRRAALWWLLPPAGLVEACMIGARIAQLTVPVPPPEPPATPPAPAARRAEDIINDHLKAYRRSRRGVRQSPTP